MAPNRANVYPSSMSIREAALNIGRASLAYFELDYFVGFIVSLLPSMALTRTEHEQAFLLCSMTNTRASGVCILAKLNKLNLHSSRVALYKL